jgi:hypothetical protein
LLLLEPSKVSKISESTSPAKIPHRSDVDHLDEEVLYVDVQEVDGFRQRPSPHLLHILKMLRGESNHSRLESQTPQAHVFMGHWPQFKVHACTGGQVRFVCDGIPSCGLLVR